MAGMEARLKNDRSTEVRTGIGEVKKIGHLRLADIVDKSSTGPNASL